MPEKRELQIGGRKGNPQFLVATIHRLHLSMIIIFLFCREPGKPLGSVSGPILPSQFYIFPPGVPMVL
jgi:hypothetical protein